MTEFEKLMAIMKRLRDKDTGCPWDSVQTHDSLKAPIIEEACEVVSGINIITETGNSDNLCEELGDLLMNIILQTIIAEEEGCFTMDDVISCISEKMIRRHPHVFGSGEADTVDEVLKNWNEIKAEEKAKKQIDEAPYLFDAFDEANKLIEKAKARKLEKQQSKKA